jgi:hypothetical protein
MRTAVFVLVTALGWGVATGIGYSLATDTRPTGPRGQQGPTRASRSQRTTRRAGKPRPCRPDRKSRPKGPTGDRGRSGKVPPPDPDSLNRQQCEALGGFSIDSCVFD